MNSFLEPLSPYSWPCVRGLFRFLTTLINNYDKYVNLICNIFCSIIIFYVFLETIPNI